MQDGEEGGQSSREKQNEGAGIKLGKIGKQRAKKPNEQ